MTKFLQLSFLFTFTFIYIYCARTIKKDVQSIESIMSALIDVISGSAKEERDWERFRYLFSEDAKLIPTPKG